MTGAEILALPMDENDAGAKTIKGYFIELLRELFREGEGFSAKRPFGNSGWEGDLQIALVKAGAVEGELNEDGRIDEVDDFAAVAAIESAIDAL